MAISKNPRTILKTNPLGLNCAEIYLSGRCWYPFSRRNIVWLEILHLSRFTIKSRLREIFFPDSAFHNFAIYL